MGYGTLLDDVVAATKKRKAVVSRAGTAEYRRAVSGGMDSDWELFFVAEGEIAGYDVFSASSAVGFVVRVRIYADGA